jgi:hypothetical protein
MGEFSETLCRANPDLEKLYLVDPWLSYTGYHTFFSQQDMDGHYQMACDRLSAFPCCELVRKTSMEAVREIPDHSLDFVYIDGNHNFQSVTNDIVEWGRRVRFGGILCGDDYRRFRDQHDSHVVFVLEGYVKAYRVKPWFVFGRDSHNATWMWVKGCEHNLLDRKTQ